MVVNCVFLQSGKNSEQTAKMLKKRDSRRGKKVCKLRWQGHLRPFFYVCENAQTRKIWGKNKAILVENEENKFL